MEAPAPMEIAAPKENSHTETSPTDDAPTPDHSNLVPDLSNANGGPEEHKLSAEEVKKELEFIASTGKFWHDWEELQNLLHFQLKQVLSGYSEATMSDEQQYASLGESYLQLVKRLEDALFRFIEGPPFTLQRLCEILLNAQLIYPKLSKLALALEKTLLVTSTLTKSTDPYPPSVAKPVELVEDTRPQSLSQAQVSHSHSNAVENGGESMTVDRDEVMSDVEAKVDEGSASHITFDELLNSIDANAKAPIKQSLPDTQNEHPEPQQPSPESSLPHPSSNAAQNGGDEVMSEVDAKTDEGREMHMTFDELITTIDANANPPSDS